MNTVNLSAIRSAALHEKVNEIMTDATSMIWITFDFEGIHQYPAAADTANEGMYDVSFLQHPHRHTFFFKVWIEVNHNDRDMEFIQFKRWCKSQFGNEGEVIQLNDSSCEMIIDKLYLKIATAFPDRNVWIEVSEDNENGVIKKFERRPPAYLS